MSNLFLRFYCFILLIVSQNILSFRNNYGAIGRNNFYHQMMITKGIHQPKIIHSTHTFMSISPMTMKWPSPFQKLFQIPSFFSAYTSSSIKSNHKNHRIKGYKSIALYCYSEPIISDETYEEWLDDIIYSGDIEGYIRRRSIDFVNEDFIGFLEERLENCQDNDEKSVLNEIILAIDQRLRESDGLVDSDLQFERRLDRILFVSPQKRREMIEESIEEITPGFINYIQSEIKSADDSDVKVVLASILQLIGQCKNEDYLSSVKDKVSDINSLKYLSSLNIDGSSSSSSTNTNINVLKSNSGGLDLSGNIEKDSKLSDTNISNNDKYYEQILAGLVFSQNEVLEDVLNNLHYIDDEFIKFLERKIERASDLEERVGLSSLLGTINTVLTRVKDVQGENFVDVNNEELTMDQVKQRMKDVQMGQDVTMKKNEYATLWDYELKNNKRETFLGILQRFQNLPDGVSLDDVVDANYELCDYQFMESLKEEIASCYAEGADIEGQQYQDLMNAINLQMVKRVSKAQEKLSTILSKPSQKAMEAEIVAMVRRGEADEALILLIEGNIQQAQQANAMDAVKLLRTLSKRINEEKERKLPEEQKLLRALLRENDSTKRKTLLFESFRPSKSINDDGEVTQGAPLISPPSFINVVRRVIQESGNIEGYKIMDRMLIIVDEAQIVATELYGEGMSPRDQQKYMFEKNTVSVWDLARFEEEAMMSGEALPWQNNAYDDKMPEDVLQERKVKQIGGLDSGGDLGI